MQEEEKSLKSLYSNIKVKGNRIVRIVTPSTWDKKTLKLFIESVKGNIDDINTAKGYVV